METNGSEDNFFLELKMRRKKLSKDNNTTTTAYQQRTITASFTSVTPSHATSKSKARKVGL